MIVARFMAGTQPDDLVPVPVRSGAGVAHRSTSASTPSTMSASTAAGSAPESMRRVSSSASPVTIGSPSPPAPMNAASVAVPR